MADRPNTAGIITFQQHIIEEQSKHSMATGEFSWLLSAITLAGKIIASNVRQAGLLDVLGTAGHSPTTNVQGETVHKLDVIANETLKRTLGYRKNVGIVASEEDAEPKVLQEPGEGGKYVVMFDPLDGSSNIDVNVSVGTIFTILRRRGPATEDRQVLQPGSKQVAAGYVLYGSSTVLVFTTGRGVSMYTLDPMMGAFVLTRENIQMPAFAAQYSVNEAYMRQFPEVYQNYFFSVKSADEQKSFSLRYIGSLVADFHRILLKGGVFLYPPTSKNPNGKLRLLYEANPLAFVAEQAGGMATNGAQRIMDIKPTSLHQRTPLIIGSKDNVEAVHRAITI